MDKNGTKDLDINVDLDQLKKYSRSGPRYTSYPTVPYFYEDINSNTYIKYLSEKKEDTRQEDISLYFHLPFCDTLCYFCGCNMLVTKNADHIDDYIDYMIAELDILLPHIGKSGIVAQLHWGGGTPTSLSPKQILRLGESIRNRFEFHKNAEISVEVDPRELTRDHLLSLHNIGFNRCSMGVQDFDAKVQKAVHRFQSEDITRQAVEWARELGFKSINIDLMYGLPYQSLKNFEKSIDSVIALNPDRLAVFNYAHLPHMIKHQKLIDDETLPAPEKKLQLFKLSIDKLSEAGYIYIGMDHFAKPEDELTLALKAGTLYRNFQGYSTHARLDLFAIGMSSISMHPEMYVQNHKNLNDYYSALDEGRLPVKKGYQLSQDDVLRREVIMDLMCNFSLDKKKIEKNYKINFDQYFSNSLEDLCECIDDGLVKIEGDIINVTNSGRLLIRNIAMNFDAYFRQKNNSQPQFSKTV